jgi:crotonobetainyl-CoA:carnitine CoA-transferase CaiB-like acyl-CoA transferase
MVEVSLPDGRKTSLPALPLELDGQRLGLRLDVPRAGEHIVTIAEEIGLDRRDIDALRRDGIIGPNTDNSTNR